MPQIVQIVLLVAVLACGLGLIRIGARGRRLDSHPLCPSCDFDLVGHFVATSRNANATQVVCPECGWSSGDGQPLRRGNKSPRPSPLIIGIAMALLAAPPLAYLCWNFMMSGLYPPYTSFQMLAAQARRGEDGATTELTRRLATGGLTPSEVSSLVAEAVRTQSDPKALWGGWSGFVSQAAAMSSISAADLRRLYAHTLLPDKHAILQVTPGQPPRLTLTVLWRGAREPAPGLIAFANSSPRLSLEIDDIAINGIQFQCSQSSWPVEAFEDHLTWLVPLRASAMPSGLKTGLYPVKITCHWKNEGLRGAAAILSSGSPLDWSETVDVVVEVRP
jgi:hypothetical protein